MYVVGCSDPTCLRCGSQGCLKCPNLIVHPSRECVDACPYGHLPRWSTSVDYIGRVCRHNGNLLGLSSHALAVLAGVATGAILCTVLVSSAALYVKYRRKNSPQPSETGSDVDESPERKDFLKQLETLRPYAQNYLDMLNDTRRQIRELHRDGDGGAISAYRPVVRDLAKILILLNRPTELIAIPEDWEHLFNWAQKALKRYKRMSEASQPQVAQLINFLQGHVLAAELEQEPEYSLRGSMTMSTFKPDQVYGSSLSLQDAAIRSFNSNYDKYNNSLNPQWKFEYSLVSNNVPSSEFNPSLWKNSKEYLNNSLFLEDDFYQLGFRPQDEITTEL
ncbi:hypothetical protein NQ318_012852 [Aromia moschata]|uniref:Uncharacterized protein n=1 Tax=Aromia moschata TaxID=1265417 RepID=A0AAV8X5W9_9CUCU|nr:hypothetical protein NQ318_012852 [Aromia moschata]